MTRRATLITLAVVVPLLLAIFAMAATTRPVGARSNPDLQSRCAPDARHYAWTITLPEEKNQILELSFGENTWQTVDFETAGIHEFLTRQEGSILTVRYADDSMPSSSTACRNPRWRSRYCVVTWRC